jgi:hypothetical protein
MNSKNCTRYTVALNDKEEVSYSTFLPVNSTENFYIHLTSCNGGYTVSGGATWSNPYGYLPGDSFMKLPVIYLFLFILFIVFFIFNLLLLIFFHNEVPN